MGCVEHEMSYADECIYRNRLNYIRSLVRAVETRSQKYEIEY